MGINVKQLVSHLKGKHSAFYGITFCRSDYCFFIRRIASGGGYGNVGGSYPVVEFLTRRLPKFIIGHEESKKYAIGSFLFLPPNETFDCSDRKLFVGSEDKRLIEAGKNFFKEKSELAELLFNKKFARVEIASRWDVFHHWPFIERRTFVSYVGMPERVYDSPAEIDNYITALVALHDSLL
jgi:hypothetical protein